MEFWGEYSTIVGHRKVIIVHVSSVSEVFFFFFEGVAAWTRFVKQAALTIPPFQRALLDQFIRKINAKHDLDVY